MTKVVAGGKRWRNLDRWFVNLALVVRRLLESTSDSSRRCPCFFPELSSVKTHPRLSQRAPGAPGDQRPYVGGVRARGCGAHMHDCPTMMSLQLLPLKEELLRAAVELMGYRLPAGAAVERSCSP